MRNLLDFEQPSVVLPKLAVLTFFSAARAISPNSENGFGKRRSPLTSILLRLSRCQSSGQVNANDVTKIASYVGKVSQNSEHLVWPSQKQTISPDLPHLEALRAKSTWRSVSLEASSA